MYKFRTGCLKLFEHIPRILQNIYLLYCILMLHSDKEGGGFIMQLEYPDKTVREKTKTFKQYFRDEYNWLLFLRDVTAFFIARAVLFNQLSPFGLAFYGACLTESSQTLSLVMFTILGMLTVVNGAGFKYIVAFLFIVACKKFLFPELRKVKLNYVALGTGCSLLIFNIAEMFLNSWKPQNVILGFVETFLCSAMVILFSYGTEIFHGSLKRNKFSNQEIMSFCIMIGFVIAGFFEWTVYDISVKYVLCIIIVMMVALQGGSAHGAITGTVVGMMLALTNNVTPFIIAIFAVSGLLSGMFQEFGKMGIISGFFVGNVLLGFYINEAWTSIPYWKEVAASSGIFLLLPKSIIEKSKSILRYNEQITSEIYHQKLKEVTIHKMHHFSQAFLKLSNTFADLAETKERLNKEDINRLFNHIADKTCANCGLRRQCWERDFYQTYQALFSMLTHAEQKGKIDYQDIPLDFSKQCVKNIEFKETMNQMFEIYRLNLSWNNKVAESRQLVAQQLKGVSTVIGNLVTELDMDLKIKEELQHTVAVELDKYNIPVEDLMIFENARGQFEVILHPRQQSNRYYWNKEVIPILSKILGRNMVTKESDNYSIEHGKIEFVEKQKFRIATAISKRAKEEDQVSGDNFSIIELKNGHSVLALSDGMGSGINANLESKVTIELLEQFLELGFDKAVTVNLINSILVMKSSEDNFSTLDMVMLDHYTGTGEFLKIGASSSFIRRDKSVEVIKSTSLPVGILTDVDMEVTPFKIQEGDMLIMMTDGVLDACEGILNKEDWMISILYQIQSHNPKDVAEWILHKAVEASGKELKDDMMVLVAKVWKTAV